MKKLHIAILLLAISLFTSCDKDPWEGLNQDYGPVFKNNGKLIKWERKILPLGTSGFVAITGPKRYANSGKEEWSSYEISIQKEYSALQHFLKFGSFKNTAYLFFEREFPISEIPEQLVNADPERFITFDATNKLVLIDIGTKTFRYQFLPNSDLIEFPSADKIFEIETQIFASSGKKTLKIIQNKEDISEIISHLISNNYNSAELGEINSHPLEIVAFYDSQKNEVFEICFGSDWVGSVEPSKSNIVKKWNIKSSGIEALKSLFY